MTADEVIADLTARIDRAVSALSELRESDDITPAENARLFAKIDGMLTVRDMLRAYRPAELSAPVLEFDRRPHSRACGVTAHPHGRRCAADCPTCHGAADGGPR